MVPNALLAGASLCPGWLWVVRQVRGTGTRIMDCALAKANTSITKSDQWWPMASWEITRNSRNPSFQLQTHRIKFPRLSDHIEEARAQLFWKGSRIVSRKAAPLLLRGMRYSFQSGKLKNNCRKCGCHNVGSWKRSYYPNCWARLTIFKEVSKNLA